MGKLSIKIILVLAFVNNFLFADVSEEKISELLNSYFRPTISDVKKAVGENFDIANPFWTGTEALQVDSGRIITLRLIRDMTAFWGPQLIAQVESLYPGAAVMSIGRDSVFISDMFDAYYSANGQQGRSLRFEASSTTFSQPQIDVLIISYFKKLGYDFQNPESIKGMRPLVLVDSSHYNHSSQSYRILAIAYRAYIDAGGNPLDLLPKLTFISTVRGGTWDANRTAHAAHAAHDAYKNNFFAKRLQEVWQSYQHGRVHLAPRTCLRFQEFDTKEEFSQNTLLTHFAFWHESYLPFHVDGQNIQPVHGGVMTPKQRRQVLAVLFDLIKEVRKPEFMSKVKFYAEKYFHHNINFSDNFAERVPYVPKPYSLKEVFVELEEEISQFRPAWRKNKERYSKNGFIFANFIDSKIGAAKAENKNDQFLLIALALAAKSNKQGTLDSRDLRYLMAHAFSLSQGNADFYEQLANAVASHPELLNTLIRKAEYFLDEDPTRKGGLKVVEVYKKLSEVLIRNHSQAVKSAKASCDLEFKGEG